MTAPNAPQSPLDMAGGLLFVVLWSTGYIAAIYGLDGSGPYTLAVVRFLGTAALIGAWLLLQRVSLPSLRATVQVGIAGVLLQAGFFGFAYAGMKAGCPPAVAGLICGLMPLTTALGAALILGERMHKRAMIGLSLGLAGVLLVVGPGLMTPGTALGYGFMFLALAALSLGTVFQKRQSGQVEPRLALVIQVLAACAVMAPIAWWTERFDYSPTNATLVGTAWVILVNSCAGVLLYLWLLRRGAAGRVSSVFFLVPPVTAVLAAGALGARFGVVDAVGFGLAAAGVWVGQRA